jgi:hypothetical protein
MDPPAVRTGVIHQRIEIQQRDDAVVFSDNAFRLRLGKLPVRASAWIGCS